MRELSSPFPSNYTFDSYLSSRSRDTRRHLRDTQMTESNRTNLTPISLPNNSIFTMEEELSLPQLAPDSHLPSKFRKRARLSSPDVSLSSDPPLFSSDDDPSADNYTNGRRKKNFRRGPWYNQGDLVDGSERQKRTLNRQVDSGVWMGSDGTDVDDAVLEFIARPGLGKLSSRIASERKRSPEELAEERIEFYLDTGNESISLIDCGLKTLSNKAIKLLSTFTSTPATEAPFQALEPQLKLLLSSNYLVKVPREIFDLQHLHMLSLRANEIRELSPAISQLKQLVELNIANNCLRFLPFEILDLFRENTQLREFRIHPNPFYEPDLPRDTDIGQNQIDGPRNLHPSHEFFALSTIPSTLGQDYLNSSKWTTTHRFSSPVRFFNISGNLAKGPILPADDDKAGSKACPSAPITKIHVAMSGEIQSPPSNIVSAAPSLLEVAMKTCYASTQLPYLTELLHPETPSYFRNLLSKAQILKEDGGQKCTVCGREFLIPRTEWIEWWEISKSDMQKENGKAGARTGWDKITGRDRIEALVPLIRRGCSWKCYEQAPT